MTFSKKIIMFHSFKGGTGRTVLAINLSYFLVKKLNYRVLLIDGDFNAPSLDQIIPYSVQQPVTWADYIGGDLELKDVIYQSKIENLDLIYAPLASQRKSLLAMNQQWWYKALERVLECRTRCFDLNYDTVIIDNQSGISPNSVNNITACDMGFIVIRPVSYGIQGTFQLIKDLYGTLQKLWNRKFYLIWNQIPHHPEMSIDNIVTEWSESFKEKNIETIAKIDYDSKLAIEMVQGSRVTSEFTGVYLPLQEEIRLLYDKLEKD